MATDAAAQRRRRRARIAPAALLVLVAALGLSASARAQTIASIAPPHSAAAPDPDGCATPDPEREARFLEARVVAPKKEAWQDARGGSLAARAQVVARLRGWPAQLLVDRAALPAEDAAFLERLARDTWKGLDALTDREHGLPIDHVRFCGGSLDPARAKIGDYTSGTNVGLHLVALAGAHELGLATREEAVAQVRRTLASLRAMETYAGFPFNYYDTTTLERTSHFVSFVDAAWLAAGLIVTRQSFPETWDECTALLDAQDFDLFYDRRHGLLLHGFTVENGFARRSRYHYGTLYTEARLGALLAIGRGEAPASTWFRMHRTLPARDAWQRQTPRDRRMKRVGAHRVAGGRYAWRGLDYVPSWGGSMFEALMPALLLDERAVAPKSLGRNGEIHAEVQRRFALEELGWPVWGMSPSTQPFAIDYSEFGVPPLGVAGYPPRVVTPHAAALALLVAPAEAAANLRRIAQLYDAYGEYGLYDSLDPTTGAVAHAYLALDQTMSFVALVNHLRGGVLQQRFAADPAVAPALPMLATENFFE